VCRGKCLVSTGHQEYVDIPQDGLSITSVHEEDDIVFSVCAVHSTIEFVECCKGIDAVALPDVGVLYAVGEADDGRGYSN